MDLKNYTEMVTAAIPAAVIDDVVKRLTEEIIKTIDRDYVRKKIYSEILRNFINDPEWGTREGEQISISFNVNARCSFEKKEEISE
jgi:hypothetical protein